jgi:hypothetical protein
MKPKERFPEPRDPTSTIVALRAKLLVTGGVEGLEGDDRGESSLKAGDKWLSVCGPIIERTSWIVGSTTMYPSYMVGCRSAFR